MAWRGASQLRLLVAPAPTLATSSSRAALRLSQHRGALKTRRAAAQKPPGGEQQGLDRAIVLGGGLLLTAAALAAFKLAAGGDFADEPDSLGAWGSAETVAGLGAGDWLGAALWGGASYFCSPLQLLLLFFGTFERDRPSDWALRQLGRAAQLDVDAVDYSAPAPLRALTALLFAGAGVAVAAALQALLGDSTWSVSSGIGACAGAAMYEAGRPERLSVEEAQTLEGQWQDFARWAAGRLQRSGRCHESEVFRAFRSAAPRYADEAVLPDARLRDMLRNFEPGVERTSQGYLKGLSLRAPGASGGGGASSSRAAGSVGGP